MISLPDISAEEILGRCIFDGKKAKQAAKGKIHPKVFRGKIGTRELSVDRLSFDADDFLFSLHESERSDQEFYGWASIDVAKATSMNREVVAKPIFTPPNPYHAEIILPDVDEDDVEDEQIQHSLNLAMHAQWRPCPAVLDNKKGG